MAEETVWRGTSSQWKNFGVYILCALFCWLIVPIFIALARYLQTKNKVYALTTERLKITEGVFNKVTDTLELYRGQGHRDAAAICLSHVRCGECAIQYFGCFIAIIFIQAIPCMIGLGDKIRAQVEAIRMQKRVREIDVE